MISFPNAKINLGLHVTEKRPDGFHNIETVLYPIPITDILEIILSEKKGIAFTATGTPIPGDPEKNLVLKAVNLISDTGYRIHLHKIIPTGAGLGGGSADGAFALKLLNDLWKLDLSVAQMQDFARRLGSDCAFFIENRPVFAFGRGDRFEPMAPDLSEYRIVIVVPPVQVSTPEAYSLVTPRQPLHSLKEIISQPVEEWTGLLTNDFEEPVMNNYPVIREVKEELYRQGAIYAAMSGSGAAVYGVFSRQWAVGSGQFDPSFRVYIG